MINQDTLENQANSIYLGIGSNLGNKKDNIEKAKAAYKSKDYQLALKALDGGADRDIRIFEGN